MHEIWASVEFESFSITSEKQLFEAIKIVKSITNKIIYAVKILPQNKFLIIFLKSSYSKKNESRRPE